MLLALREHGGIERADVEAVRAQKRRVRGGFEDGIVLRQTTEPPDPDQLITDDAAVSTVSPESLRELTDAHPHQVSPTAVFIPRVPPFGTIDGSATTFTVRILGRTLSVEQAPKGVTISLSTPEGRRTAASREQLAFDINGQPARAVEPDR